MKSKAFRFALGTAVAAAWLAPAATAVAADPPRPPTLEELQTQIETQSKVLAQQQRALREQQRKLQQYKKALDQALSDQGSKIENLEAWRATGAPQQPPVRIGANAVPGAAPTSAPATQTVAQSPQERVPDAPPQPVGQAPEKKKRAPEVAPLGTNQPGVLTPKGQFVFEPSFEYSHSSNNRVALVGFTVVPAITIGLIDVRSVNRDFFTLGLTGRYGLTNRLEVEAKVPFLYRQDSTLARPLATPSSTDSVFDADGKGLGDIEIAARYQFNQGGPHVPYWVGSLRFKTVTGDGPFDVATTTLAPGFTVNSDLPTGTGFYALQPSITALFPSDPVVFFGGMSYIWNIKRDVNKMYGTTFIHNYDPGDGVTFNFGMGLALNQRSSFSLGYEHDIFFKDKQDGETVANAQTRHLGQLQVGWAYNFSEDKNFNLSLGIGVTEEAPDVTINARMPISF